MSNKRIYTAVVIAVFLVVGAVIWGAKQPQKANAPTVEQETAVKSNPTDEIIYFYGAECPHCKDVTQFLEDNKIADKVNFVKKEVWHDTTNAAEMQKKAQECSIQPSGMGVPFVYAKGKCYIGTPDVEAFFQQAAGIQ
jgi:glutaredoxin